MQWREPATALGVSIIVIALLIALGFAGVAVLSWLHDDCDDAVPLAERAGLSLSSGDEVLSCEMRPAMPDSSASLEVRTASETDRLALLQRSGATIRSGGDREPGVIEYGRDQIPTYTLRITYDENVEHGLLLHVHAATM
ncbi:hypothetical protein [Gordonia sp. VNK21]|uniref:hypothetical protein n=1 Tax=Gordonia sp. VNK21 TaxID=3382483 RepID=UPI0038D4605A